MSEFLKIKFLHILAIVVVLLVFGFDFSMFFVKYPADNRDMINSVSGILNSGGLIMILSFFYGSSKSSHDKNDLLKKAEADTTTSTTTKTEQTKIETQN